MNIAELKYLIQESLKSGNTIRGKEIILLMGWTGAGKSTTVHFLCGSEFKKINNNNYKVVKSNNVDLENLDRVNV